MIIGIPKEIKDNEERVAIVPDGVLALKAASHQVLVQKNAGLGSGISDEDFIKAGAEIIDSAEEIWKTADIIVKVKEPVKQELDFLKYLKEKILFTYLHLSGVDPKLTEVLLENKVTAIAYETIEDEKGGLPLLAPMSEVAAVIGIEEGAHYLKKRYKGRGLTLGKITGVESATVVIVGGGVVGTKAAETAAGMGSNIILLQIKDQRFDFLKSHFSQFSNVKIIESNSDTLAEYVPQADLLIGAVLIKGATAPKIITKEMIAKMKPGAVVIDIAIDQGGCTELSRPTTHSDPIYYTDNGVIFYCVTNMPGQAARQSTFALTSQTLPYLLKIAENQSDPGLKKGFNAFKGFITYEQVAKDLKITEKYKSIDEVLKQE